MTYGLGVDLGGSSAAAAVTRAAGVEMATLGARLSTIPSTVLARDTGELVCGETAEWQSTGDPTRVAREFRRRLGDPTPLILAGRPYPPTVLLAAQLRDVVSTVTQLEGRRPDEVVLTHPAAWGPYRRGQYADVARLAGLEDVGFVTEPEATTFSVRSSTAPSTPSAAHSTPPTSPPATSPPSCWPAAPPRSPWSRTSCPRRWAFLSARTPIPTTWWPSAPPPSPAPGRCGESRHDFQDGAATRAR